MCVETKKNKYFILYLPSASYVWPLPLKQGFSICSVCSWRQTSELLEILRILFSCVTVLGKGIRGAGLGLVILYHTHCHGEWGAVFSRGCWGVRCGTFSCPVTEGSDFVILKKDGEVLFLLLGLLRSEWDLQSPHRSPDGHCWGAPSETATDRDSPCRATWNEQLGSKTPFRVFFALLFPCFLTGRRC